MLDKTLALQGNAQALQVRAADFLWNRSAS
nr:MAG TPA: hypothetical protein [Caudoviricetes sp.]